MRKPNPIVRAAICSLALAAAMNIVANSTAVLAADPPKPSIDAESQKVIDAFAGYFGKLQGFQVDAKVDINVQQGPLKESQQVVQRMAAQRPNQLHVTMTVDDTGAEIVSDGKDLTLSIISLQRFATEKAPKDWKGILQNELVEGIMSAGNISNVTAAMLSDDPAARLVERMSSVKYVGKQNFAGIECHHLRAEGEQLDWDLLIQTGDKPLPRQFTPDMTKMIAVMMKQMGQKDMGDFKGSTVATFSGWDSDPKFGPDAFAFNPPDNSRKVGSFMDIVGGPSGPRGPHPLVGKPAPQIDVELVDGGKLDLASLKNKNVVILDFWATWCGPCRMAMPIIEKVADEFKDQGVKLYAVNIQEDAEKIQEFLKESKLDLTVAMDKTAAVARAYKADGIPQTVLVGKDGSVQVVKIGLSPSLEDDLRRDLKALVAGKDLAAEELAKFKQSEPAADKP